MQDPGVERPGPAPSHHEGRRLIGTMLYRIPDRCHDADEVASYAG